MLPCCFQYYRENANYRDDITGYELDIRCTKSRTKIALRVTYMNGLEL